MALSERVMMGLLDPTDDPRTMGLLSLGMGLLGSKGSFGNALSQAGPQALQAMRQVQQDKQRKEQQAQAQQMQQLQMQQAQMQMAEQQRQQALMQGRQTAFKGAFVPGMPGVGSPNGDVTGDFTAPGTAPSLNMSKYLQALVQGGDVEGAMPIYQSMQKDTKPIALAEGGELRLPDGTLVARNAKAPEVAKLPSAVQEYQFAVSQGYKGTFEQFQTGMKKAGATNIGLPKIDIKMGESVAGQIGPMAKDSRIQVQGAVGMFDSADRIQKALDSGNVSAGPLTTQIQTVKQLIQKVGGGNDEGIRQTRQVIKGLAQMSVEARKELAGQGQVTESEAAAVAKAESGDINDLTTGELQDLVTLTKRAAHMRAKSHQSIIESMTSNDATRGVVPFYQVPGMDRLLKHSPQLPQIGGGSAVDAALQKYGPK